MENLKNLLERHYQNHKEENRLETRHGRVEFSTTIYFIKKRLAKIQNLLKKSGENRKIKVLDLGAGTGKYSLALLKMGCDVTAVELTQKNFQILQKKHEKIKLWQGDARDLHFLSDETFDLTLNFGPLYHLHGDDEKLKALLEARRVTKHSGTIFNAYLLNEYSILRYCFLENRISKLLESGAVDKFFHTKAQNEDFYDFVRINDINKLNCRAGFRRIFAFSPDGPADFLRRELNAMTESDFLIFLRYQIQNARRKDLLGAGSHLVDEVRKLDSNFD